MGANRNKARKLCGDAHQLLTRAREMLDTAMRYADNDRDVGTEAFGDLFENFEYAKDGLRETKKNINAMIRSLGD